jgi:hypothetical protein
MPLQNRVDPFATIFRTTARGIMFGNRGGVLHNSDREIVRSYACRRWLICVLEFKGRRRTVMTPDRYTELFFLDEAVALSAGHRPCAECRRARFEDFRRAWGERLLAPEMDAELHRDRIDRNGRKVTHEDKLDSLPDGCFVALGGSAYLVWGDSLFPWTPFGYGQRESRPGGKTATVLTPAVTVRCLRNGYIPDVHESCRTSSGQVGFVMLTKDNSISSV